MACTLTKKFQRALESCHSYLDYAILEESIENVLGYQRRKRGGLIDDDQIEMFNSREHGA